MTVYLLTSYERNIILLQATLQKHEQKNITFYRWHHCKSPWDSQSILNSREVLDFICNFNSGCCWLHNFDIIQTAFLSFCMTHFELWNKFGTYFFKSKSFPWCCMLFHTVLETCGAKDSYIVDLGMVRCKKLPSHSDFTSEDRAPYNCLAE